MNVPHSLIWKLMLYKLKLGHNAGETIKKICYAKGEGTVGYSTVTRWFKKFCMICQKSQWSGSPKSINSDTA